MEMTRTGATPLAERLADGDVAVGATCASAHPSVVEAFGTLDLDFVWVDLEHSGPAATDARTVEDLARASDCAGLDLVVRVPSADPATVRKVLDAGVRTVLVPRVETADEVREAVAAGRYAHDGGVGDRGLAGVRANRWAAEADLDGFTEREDREVLVGAMIENRRALDAVEDILAVPDLGFAFVGPWDLSHSLGRPLDDQHEEVRTAVDEARRACVDAGVPVMGFAGEPEEAAAMVEDGYRLLVLGDEIQAYRERYGGWRADFEAARAADEQ